MGAIRLLSCFAVALVPCLATPSSAAIVQRLSVDQRGDVVLVGNTLAHDCGAGIPLPLVGVVGDCGDELSDGGADVFWSADPEGVEAAIANRDVAVDAASSAAVLELPLGSVVTHARLYWSAVRGEGDVARARLSRDGEFSVEVDADATTVVVSGTDDFYQSTADVTELVRQRGAGSYRVGGIDARDPVDLDDAAFYAGWWLVTFYQLDSDPPRSLNVYDGLELVANGASRAVTLSPFNVPVAGFDARLAVVAFEGDELLAGDELRFGPAAPLGLGDRLLGSDNFFDGSRQVNGQASSPAGDLPRLSGEPASLSGMDLDFVDVTDRVVGNQTSAVVEASTAFDLFLLSGLVTSVSTFLPDLSSSTKSVSDVDGEPLRPGDLLEYDITVTNTGSDAAVDVALLDQLPEGVTFVPGSLAIVSGANAGALTAEPDVDVGEVLSVGGVDTVSVRIGVGADGSSGGRLAVGDATRIIYRVQLAPDAAGSIENQAEISATAERGAVTSVTPTDGNLAAGPGQPPTRIEVDDCADDDDCTLPQAPFCDVAAETRRCVECLADVHCSGLQPDCAVNRVCACEGSGLEIACDGRDDNCDGQIDEGLAGVPCSAGLGACAVLGVTVCDVLSNARCDAVAGAPSTEICRGGLDEDCDGLVDIDDADCADTDGDALADVIEVQVGTDPSDADSDDDGVLDGAEPSFDVDSDGDGVINALDPDSDDDGLLDGTELGRVCADADTRADRCVPDSDAGATTTDPLSSDSDGGGARDGSEDANLNGVLDVGETDPGGADDDPGVVDADADGLSDALERFIGSDPEDADSDDDGLPDGFEPNPSQDTDEDGLVNVIDVDSDDDALFDGTETGRGCQDVATSSEKPHCIADADSGATVTSALLADTDGGGVRDGSEDANRNGAVDGSETDPSRGGRDDDDGVADSDGDGLSDALELDLGSLPDDADSDDDGSADGEEHDPSADVDVDGRRSVVDPDSDGDGLLDGTELGVDCAGADTLTDLCVPDADPSTTTLAQRADTDGGGALDGGEDLNRNGALEGGETSPNDPLDDVLAPVCRADEDCDGLNSGQVCELASCTPGCRDQAGAGCPEGRICLFGAGAIGDCGLALEPPDAGAEDAGPRIEPAVDSGRGAFPDSGPDAGPVGDHDSGTPPVRQAIELPRGVAVGGGACAWRPVNPRSSGWGVGWVLVVGVAAGRRARRRRLSLRR